MSSGQAHTVGLLPVFGACSISSYRRGFPWLCPSDSIRMASSRHSDGPLGTVTCGAIDTSLGQMALQLPNNLLLNEPVSPRFSTIYPTGPIDIYLGSGLIISHMANETVICTYRVSQEAEDEFVKLLGRHWHTLHDLGFV